MGDGVGPGGWSPDAGGVSRNPERFIEWEELLVPESTLFDAVQDGLGFGVAGIGQTERERRHHVGFEVG